MAICQQCLIPWSWKTTVKETNKIGKPMLCPHCNNVQYLSAVSKQRTGTFNLLIPPLIILPSSLFQFSLIETVSIGVIALALIPLVYPRFAELSNENEDEPLW